MENLEVIKTKWQVGLSVDSSDILMLMRPWYSIYYSAKVSTDACNPSQSAFSIEEDTWKFSGMTIPGGFINGFAPTFLLSKLCQLTEIELQLSTNLLIFPNVGLRRVRLF